jgi:NADH dehydrogenase FAD-containing subunit
MRKAQHVWIHAVRSCIAVIKQRFRTVMSESFDLVIVGAGFSGIGMLKRLPNLSSAY